MGLPGEQQAAQTGKLGRALRAWLMRAVQVVCRPAVCLQLQAAFAQPAKACKRSEWITTTLLSLMHAVFCNTQCASCTHYSCCVLRLHRSSSDALLCAAVCCCVCCRGGPPRGGAPPKELTMFIAGLGPGAHEQVGRQGQKTAAGADMLFLCMSCVQCLQWLDVLASCSMKQHACVFCNSDVRLLRCMVVRLSPHASRCPRLFPPHRQIKHPYQIQLGRQALACCPATCRAAPCLPSPCSLYQPLQEPHQTCNARYKVPADSSALYLRTPAHPNRSSTQKP
jgi:hypothetical protein